MSVERVTAARLRCGLVGDAGRCGSLLWSDADLDDEQVYAGARERGWEAGERVRCPKHRGAEPEPEPEPDDPDVEVRRPVEETHTIPG